MLLIPRTLPSSPRKLAHLRIYVYASCLELTNVTRTGAIGYSDNFGPPADDNSFRFTPIKALRALPRLWERKPATPFKAGLKRKLWKRFQSSFSNMQTLESSTAIDPDALHTAINASKDSTYVRGVKRLCVGSEGSTGSTNQANIELSQAAHPFLETKWDSEASRKRRKCYIFQYYAVGNSLMTDFREIAGCSLRRLRRKLNHDIRSHR